MFFSAGAQKAKIDAETAVIRTLLAATNQVKNIRYIGQELYKTGKITAFTESDMLTGYEMNEVKTSDYSKETKLSGRDMYQFTNHKRFFEVKSQLSILRGRRSDHFASSKNGSISSQRR